jgi:DNA-binding transcriptional MocR family regulator
VLEQNYFTGTTAVNIADSAEAAVLSGKLAAGARLPTIRAIAKHLGVANATVAAAFRILQDRGVIVADGSRGTRVRTAPPISLPVAADPPLPPGAVDLREGNPDLALLPDLARGMQKKMPRQRMYGEELNDAELLALARDWFRDDKIPATDIAVVSGALDGIERVLREHLRAGDRVAVEDPCFTGVLDLLNALSLVAVPVAVDDEGMQPQELRRALKTCDAAIVTPRAQNPTGAAHSIRRARELRSVLADFPDVLLIEDDHAGRVAGAEYRTLVYEERANWAVVRSVAKALGPDLRVALLASDARTHARVEGRQTLGIRWVSHILQRLVVALWRDRAPSKAEQTYTRRRVALLRALRERGIHAHGASGLNVWIPVRDETPIVEALLQRGWAVQAGARYRIGARPAIRVTIAALEPDDAERFAEDFIAIAARKKVGRV